MLVCGNCFINGTGLVHGSDDPRLWINQLADTLGYNLTNIAQTGRTMIGYF